MNIIGRADIYSHDKARVRRIQRSSSLGLADKTPRCFFGFRFYTPIVGQLNNSKVKITLAPALTPGPDQGGEQNVILLGPCLIRFALIPNRTFYCKRD